MTYSTLPLRPNFNAFKVKWDRLITKVCDPYRPELHYMRGPGLKWRAKHQSSGQGSQL
jgi:hypothetical protein